MYKHARGFEPPDALFRNCTVPSMVYGPPKPSLDQLQERPSVSVDEWHATLERVSELVKKRDQRARIVREICTLIYLEARYQQLAREFNISRYAFLRLIELPTWVNA